MSRAPSLLEPFARLIVDSIRASTRRRTAAAVGGLVVTLVAALSYLVVGSLGINPLRSTIDVHVILRESGGLMPNQDVTLRGVRIGRVKSVQFTRAGVAASAEIVSDARIPQSSLVRVSALSPAGEQYLDFRPQEAGGPVLTNGSTIAENQTSIPVSLAQLLGDANGALAQLDPEKLNLITDELRVGNQGPAKLAALLDGGAFLISTLDSVLPETTSLLRSSRTVLTTMVDVTPGLQATSGNLQAIMVGVNAMDGGFRKLIDSGAEPLTELDQFVADNRETMVKLLGNLTTVAQLVTVRVPALTELVNSSRGESSVETLTGVVRDGGIWAIADIYPRYSCDYDVPRLPPFLPNFPEPYMHTYCKNPDPSVLVRGARNAPRPPGDDTAGPAPGYDGDPLAEIPPTPVGANTIPTPFGGFPMPMPLPPDPPDWTPPPGWPLELLPAPEPPS